MRPTIEISHLEQSILGAILLDNKQLQLISEVIKPLDFFDPVNRIVFETMGKLEADGIPIDIVTLESAITIPNQEETIFSYLAGIIKNTASAANGLAYAKILHEQTVRRELNNVLTKIQFSNTPDRTLNEVLDDAQRGIMELSSEISNKDGSTLEDCFTAFFTELDEALQGNGPKRLKTGYSLLDDLLQGMRGGNLIIIAGRPSMGKTTFALNICKNILLNERVPIQFFSFEMGEAEIIRSLLAMTGTVPLTHLKDICMPDMSMGRTMHALKELNDAKAELQIHTIGSTIAAVKIAARRHKILKPNLGLIVIDYLQLISKPNSENRVLEVSAITRSLKLLARELDVPIIALSQLSRKNQERADTTPRLSDLRDSGSIEQDSDVVMFVHRVDEKARIVVGKNRSGPIGDVELIFNGVCAQFKQGY